MPIDITCTDCSQSYKVPDNVAGKKIRCPKCNVAVVQVPQPQAVGSAATGASNAAVDTQAGQQASSQSGSDQWQLKTETGDTYGPVDRTELDQWVAEGRVNAQTQLLRQGESQWQWATTIYPHLASVNGGSQGGDLSVSPVVSTGQPYQHQYVNQQQAYAPTQRGAVGEKSKVVAGLLALLIGTLGIHNFYMGYTGRGLAQLLITVLSCFVLSFATGIWAMIEGIMILTGGIDRDADGYLLRD